jgi:hypothetical protein
MRYEVSELHTFCSLMIELNQSDDNKRDSILLAAYQEFNVLEKNYAVFKKTLAHLIF